MQNVRRINVTEQSDEEITQYAPIAKDLGCRMIVGPGTPHIILFVPDREQAGQILDVEISEMKGWLQKAQVINCLVNMWDAIGDFATANPEPSYDYVMSSIEIVREGWNTEYQVQKVVQVLESLDRLMTDFGIHGPKQAEALVAVEYMNSLLPQNA